MGAQPPWRGIGQPITTSSYPLFFLSHTFFFSFLSIHFSFFPFCFFFYLILIVFLFASFLLACLCLVFCCASCFVPIMFFMVVFYSVLFYCISCASVCCIVRCTRLCDLSCTAHGTFLFLKAKMLFLLVDLRCKVRVSSTSPNHVAKNPCLMVVFRRVGMDHISPGANNPLFVGA